MAAVVFTELGIVINNTEYVYYLLPTLTKSAASTKLVMVMTGLDHPIQARQYMVEKSQEFEIPALVVENALCKIQLGYMVKIGKYW